MPMRRDQPLPNLCPASVLKSGGAPRLRAVFRRALRVAFATTVISVGCTNSHTDALPPGGGRPESPEMHVAGRAAPNGRAGSIASPMDDPKSPPRSIAGAPGTPKPPAIVGGSGAPTPPTTAAGSGAPTKPPTGGKGSTGGKGEGAVCKNNAWQPLEGLEPAEPADYVSLLVALGSASVGMERASTGTACAGSNADCDNALNIAKQTQGLSLTQSCGQVGPCRTYVVTTADGEVKRYTNREELLEFLGPISTPQEAFLLLEYDGYVVRCAPNSTIDLAPGAEPSSAVATADGFEATVMMMVNDCPITYVQVVASVSRNGEVKELSREMLAASNACAGRRPEGWVAQGTAFSGSTLADHFAIMAEFEAASVTAFEVLAGELAHHGAPADLIERLREAAREEVVHARETSAMARALGAEPKPARIEPKPIRSLEAIALDNAVEGCVRETFGAAVGCYQAEAACDPRIAALMRQLAADEIGHAELAFDLHDWLIPKLSAAARARVMSAREAAVDTLACELQVEPGVALRELAGLPGANAAAKLHETLRRELWATA
jgi:rubrerythrin